MEDLADTLTVKQIGGGAAEVATTALMAFTTGAFYLAGGIAAALTTVPTWPDVTAATATVLALSTIAILSGLALLRWGRYLPRWAFHGVVASASAMLATGVVLSQSRSAALGVAAVFVFCAVDILYFFHGRQALVQVLLLLTAVAASLTARGTHPAITLSLLMVQVAVVIVIGRLVDRAAQGARDSLTGLPNRRGFDERLERAAASTRRGANRSSPTLATHLSVALIDVDHFKTVNDREGHPAGDALLRRLASAWSNTLPEGVTLTRLGGDEFALLAPHHDASQLAGLCDQLHTLAAPKTISIGVAELEHAEDSASLVRRADSALYAAKAAGRACTRSADASEDGLSADLTTAVATGRIDVVLQPIVRPGTSDLVAVEALARWHHHELGPIPPSHFIPLAERTGQINDLGALVVQKACHDAVQLQQQLGRAVLVTVNASAQQLTKDRFLHDVTRAVHSAGLLAEHLVVEVTESSVQIASAAAHATLQGLRELGIKVAIDDFGTGYSAFSHLDTLPADYLKLDTAFTAATTSSPRRAAMLRALLELCRDLQITVIAEGVETKEQADLLHAMGCPLTQGYFYARPCALKDSPRWAAPEITTTVAEANSA